MKTGKLIPVISTTSYYLRNLINSSLKKFNSLESILEVKRTPIYSRHESASSEHPPTESQSSSQVKVSHSSAAKSTTVNDSKSVQVKPNEVVNSNVGGEHQVFESAVHEWFNARSPEDTIESHQQTKPVADQILVPTLNKSAIESRTKQLVNSLQSCKISVSQSQRIRELCKHLVRYPEARGVACRDGAIAWLLKTRQHTKDQLVKAHSRQALTLLGYCDPPKGRGIRILSIDGGGTRGLVVLEMLRQLEQLAQKPLHQLFDVICGVSTGAIISMLIGALQIPVDKCEEYYRHFSSHVFKSDWRGAGRLIWSHAYYDTNVWEKVLKDIFGELDLIDTSQHAQVPKILAISAIMNMHTIEAFLFRNYSLPHRCYGVYHGSCAYKVWQAVRASAAAPGYFEEFTLDNYVHQDGGILINNPTAVAIQEAKLLWPTEEIECVVSLGSGRYIPPQGLYQEPVNSMPTSLKTKIFRFIDSATDTEMVHRLMQDLLPQGSYYRLNPTLSEMGNLDENRPDKLEQMKMDAQMYLRKNEYKVKQVIKDITKRRGIFQATGDWLRLQYNIHG